MIKVPTIESKKIVPKLTVPIIQTGTENAIIGGKKVTNTTTGNADR
jgi:hypothetical protein